MTTTASDEKIKVSREVNTVLYELFHCLVMLKYIEIVCVDFTVMQTDMAGPRKDMRRRNQYDFIKFWFSSVVINGEERPQCAICCEALANESFNVNKLMQHVKTKHGFLADCSENSLRERLKLQRKLYLIVEALTSK
jgi:hypothetical protein